MTADAEFDVMLRERSADPQVRALMARLYDLFDGDGYMEQEDGFRRVTTRIPGGHMTKDVNGHCWHGLDMTMGNMSAARCCHCGIDQTTKYERFTPPGHGPHMDASYDVPVTSGGENPCVPTATGAPSDDARLAQMGGSDG